MGVISPTEAQKDYAKQLGIDIPAGISRSQLSRLIDHAKRRTAAEQHGLDRHPDETALPAAAGIGRHESRVDDIKSASRVLRRLRIHEGSIIAYEDTARSYVVIGIEQCQLVVQAVEGRQDKSRWDIVPKGRDSGTPDPFMLVFNPPERFLHRFCFRHKLRALVDEARRDRMWRYKGREFCYDVVEKYLDDVKWSLLSPNKVETAYGEFWQRDAVQGYIDRDFIDFLRTKASAS